MTTRTFLIPGAKGHSEPHIAAFEGDENMMRIGDAIVIEDKFCKISGLERVEREGIENACLVHIEGIK